ncbi:beta-defensin 18 precursor [Rattus norvegicus]|uniref:Beta-defensin 18 n=1 Tax=Rattus norvegicus TaxID=10116 RepID=DFB18_RAT|nr:beta-defensin 18 precursor [Rattus norvegicus]Q32ZH4.1 RecName: Full=Beta-defensin 18; Short=BD-18; AltName: Full=Defensin, beta 18; Flags: Precursor [Rattus norvegicus]AAT51888.1 beta-defensin 18 [Rattus norvegicus]|eukprot:NP_001032619.1 beta-defensin 18 precursor [Rattus norvegicus]
MQSAMKLFFIFLIFVFSVSCGPSAPQMKTRDVLERTHKCFLVGGECKSECSSWEYEYVFCYTGPCCVMREYKRVEKFSNTPKYTT